MTNSLYGRKYSIQVVLDDGSALEISNSEFEPEALRVVFDIKKTGYKAWWYGDVTIFNLKEETQDAILARAERVIMSAGYQNGNYGQIFDGNVFQKLYDRENVVDYRVTLHCLDSDQKINNNFVKFTVSNQYTRQVDIIRKMAGSARTPIPIGGISNNLDQTVLPRGKTVFGKPVDYFRSISLHNGAQYWMDSGDLCISKLTDPSQGEALVITPSTGLVGTPEQIDYGASFMCLLNPNLRIVRPPAGPMLVKLDMSLIRQEKKSIGQFVSLLDQDGVYKIAEVRHTGDTRGPEWYTRVISVGSLGKIPFMLDTVSQNPNGPG